MGKATVFVEVYIRVPLTEDRSEHVHPDRIHWKTHWFLMCMQSSSVQLAFPTAGALRVPLLEYDSKYLLLCQCHRYHVVKRTYRRHYLQEDDCDFNLNNHNVTVSRT